MFLMFLAGALRLDCVRAGSVLAPVTLKPTPTPSTTTSPGIIKLSKNQEEESLWAAVAD